MRGNFFVLTVKKRLKWMYIYGSYHKIKTGVPLFGPPGVCLLKLFVRVLYVLSSLQWRIYKMSAEEHATPASPDVGAGDVKSPEAGTEHAQSKPEVTSSEHVTDDTSSPSGWLFFSTFCRKAVKL